MKKRYIILSLALIIVVGLTAVFFPSGVDVRAAFYLVVNNDINPPASPENPIELIDQRTESSKKYSLGGDSYAIEARIGVIHYKDNPSDEYETWKDINTEISINGIVNTAPYDLKVYLEGSPGFHYVSKESGEFEVRINKARQDADTPKVVQPDKKVKPVIEGNTVTWRDYYPDVDVVLTAFNSGVSLNRIIKSPSAPLEYDVEITEIEKGEAKLIPLKPAIDAEGQLIKMEEKSTLDGRTETLKLEVIEQEGIEVKPIKYPITDATEIDEVVENEADDGYSDGGATYYPDDALNNIYVGNFFGGSSDAWYRFVSVTIPDGANIEVNCYVTLYWMTASASVVSNIYFEDDATPAAPTSKADHLGKSRTTAFVAWDGQTGDYQQHQSGEIKPIIEELMASYSYAGGAAMQVLHDDDGTSAWVRQGHADLTVSLAELHIEYTEGGGDPSLTNAPASKDFSAVAESTTYWSNGSEPTWVLTDGDAFFTITNDGAISIDITIKGTNFTGGNGWTLTGGSPGEATVRLSAFKEGDGSTDNVTFTTGESAFISSLAASANISWELKLETGTFTDGVEKSSTVTLTASAS